MATSQQDLEDSKKGGGLSGPPSAQIVFLSLSLFSILSVLPFTSNQRVC